MRNSLHSAALAAAALAAAALCGCGGGGGAGGAAGESVLRKPMEAVNTTDPVKCSSLYAARVVHMLYEPVLSVDYHARPYRIRAGACMPPEVSEDGLTYVFKMAPGLSFAPDPCFGTGPGGTPRGRAVTAHDVAYSLNRLADPANASGGSWTVKGAKKIEAVDDSTLRITLERPAHQFQWMLTTQYTAVVPREAVEKYGEDFGSHPVGSGPYTLEKWRRNHSMTFRRREDWHGWTDGTASARHPDGRPISPSEGRPFDRVEYLAIADYTTQWLLFLKGEVNMLTRISNETWDAIVGPDGDISPELKAEGVKLHGLTAMEVAYVAFNMDDPVVGRNRALRQALSCAFDFGRWSKIHNGRVTLADGPVPDCVAEGRLGTPSPWRFDLEKAKRLMAEAGYPGGIDPATGRRLTLTLDLNGTQDSRQNAEMLAAMFERIGVKLEPSYMTWPALLKSTNERRSQMFSMAWVGDYPDAENFLMLFYGPNSSPGPNRCNFSDPEFDAQYEKAMSARDAATRDKAWIAAQEVLRRECPWICTGYQKSFTLVRPDVLGFKPTDFTPGEEVHLRAAVRPDGGAR